MLGKLSRVQHIVALERLVSLAVQLGGCDRPAWTCLFEGFYNMIYMDLVNVMDVSLT